MQITFRGEYLVEGVTIIGLLDGKSAEIVRVSYFKDGAVVVVVLSFYRKVTNQSVGLFCVCHSGCVLSVV